MKIFYKQIIYGILSITTYENIFPLKFQNLNNRTNVCILKYCLNKLNGIKLINSGLGLSENYNYWLYLFV